MRGRRLGRYLSALAVLVLVGCSLVVVDLSDIDRDCGAGRKLCGTGHCVDVNDPAYGCTRESCQPCALNNAVPQCDAGVCEVRACLYGFSCPTMTGCPDNILVDSRNCGDCNKVCDGGESCRDGQCVPL